MTVNPGVVRYAEVLRRARVADRAHAVEALTAVLQEHAPSPRLARSVNSLRCPAHNPVEHPGLYARVGDIWAMFDRCPTCTVDWYVYCSAAHCCDSGYPCDTVNTIAAALGEVRT